MITREDYLKAIETVKLYQEQLKKDLELSASLTDVVPQKGDMVRYIRPLDARKRNLIIGETYEVFRVDYDSKWEPFSRVFIRVNGAYQRVDCFQFRASFVIVR